VERIRVDLRGPPQTVLATLYAKALNEAVVLHVGCGLDARVYRLNPGEGVWWYDVDYPDVITLRERVYPVQHVRDSNSGNQRGGAPLGIRLHWGIDGPADIVDATPGVRLLAWESVFDSETFAQVSPAFRWLGRAMSAVPALRTMAQHHRYAFGAPGPGKG
jgi:Leucine carboxyl methyltransferase